MLVETKVTVWHLTRYYLVLCGVTFLQGSQLETWPRKSGVPESMQKVLLKRLTH